MKRLSFRLLALILSIALILTGCSLDFAGYFSRLAKVFQPVTFENMTYTRPEPELLEEALANCLQSAQGSDLDKLVGHINTINSLCNSFQTSFYLAYIHYSIDMTDPYWASEYDFCSGISTQVQASVDELMYALAASPLRKELEGEEYFGAGYFDDYDGESLWTDEFTELMSRQAQLLTQYYELSSVANMMDPQSEAFYSSVGLQLEQLYIDLINVRLELAREAGFDSYAEFAYDFTYGRSYTPEQTRGYLAQIRSNFVDLYLGLEQSNLWAGSLAYSTEDMTFGYVKSMASSMGGIIADAFATMESGNLYHISYGENKFNGSFEVFLPDYQVPFVFINPTMTNQDHLSFAHEFGHFCNDYATLGGIPSVDVAEFFSQGMEYLSLCYGGEELTAMKMADSLCAFIEQSFLADFEDRLYAMEPEELTAENIRSLYARVAADYGLGDYVDSRSYVLVPHLYHSPMYVISYVVSNDAAMQLYAMELEQTGSGLDCYTSQLTSTQGDLLEFMKEAGLESPFEADHISSIKKLLQDTL